MNKHMFAVKDPLTYTKYKEKVSQLDNLRKIWVEIIVPAVLYSCIGAITWAVRGSDGYGGFDGALVHGMAWALLWYYFAYVRGIDARKSAFWLGLGVSIGGFWGYGQYVSWIQGVFYTNTGVTPYESISVNPIHGYVWFWIVGAIWLGIGGIILGWSMEKKNEKRTFLEVMKKWGPRILIPLSFAVMGYLIVKFQPSWFFPNYSESLYTELNCPDCINRTISTNTTNFVMLMWWIGAILTSILQADRTTTFCGLFMGSIFGFFYMLSAMWTLGYVYAPSFIDWWKMWELSAGFTSGLLYAILQHILFRKMDSVHEEQIHKEKSKIDKNQSDNQNMIERRNNGYLIFTNFAYSLILIYGGSLSIGLFFELYPSDIDQYSFPFERIILFLIGAIPILVWGFYKLVKNYTESKKGEYDRFKIPDIHIKIRLQLLYLLIISTIIAWPTKIIIFYILCYCATNLVLLYYEKILRR
ncbi:MAG: hypothetical protein GF364_04300 [Candidatus Lokiarchaeota archaeon]|nr:hypothetical protein [Candidatus Lokiarchaeota archaeon]